MAIYEAKPVRVKAYCIKAVGKTNVDYSVTLDLENGFSEIATSAMMSIMIPKPGDYRVNIIWPKMPNENHKS